ncbi:hypothetical protein [Pseudomonas marginalis]|uniref:hypothetical protein n=1 Tax=Pseudomonas marginalis TaxID=298 RepID=UPI00203320E8|nr:hypothetical protein [Pseudomonas marginalis]MCM2380934.1 hypothetical protein [Pseudomonas marginalis]
MPSFYSERTAEYILIPKFSKVLKPLGSVIPMFFSGNREDTRVAFESLCTDRFHLVAFFARRPKIDRARSRSIEAKINKALFQVGRCAQELGISTFCGVSLTNNIFDQEVAEALWFDISGLGHEEDVRFFCEVNEALELDRFDGPIQPTSYAAALSSVSNSVVLDWAGVTEIMRELPKRSDQSLPGQYKFFSQVWRLRPVFFAIRL